MHDGAFTTLEAAIRHHLDPVASARAYSPVAEGLDTDLLGATAPIQPVLDRLDPLLASPTPLSEEQIEDLVAFVKEALRDPRATPSNLMKLVPRRLPSGRPPLVFEFP
jgi:cytochrome c peroxidase